MKYEYVRFVKLIFSLQSSTSSLLLSRVEMCHRDLSYVIRHSLFVGGNFCQLDDYFLDVSSYIIILKSTILLIWGCLKKASHSFFGYHYLGCVDGKVFRQKSFGLKFLGVEFLTILFPNRMLMFIVGQLKIF